MAYVNVTSRFSYEPHSGYTDGSIFIASMGLVEGDVVTGIQNLPSWAIIPGDQCATFSFELIGLEYETGTDTGGYWSNNGVSKVFFAINGHENTLAAP